MDCVASTLPAVLTCWVGREAPVLGSPWLLPRLPFEQPALAYLAFHRRPLALQLVTWGILQEDGFLV